MEDILIKRLESISSAISKLTDEALIYKDDVNINNADDLEIVLGKLNVTVKRFVTELNSSLSMNEMQSFVDEITSFSEVQLRGEEVLAELDIKLRRVRENSKSNLSQNKSATITGKLPKLNMPEFSGNILEWHQFWDQFCSNIGNRDLSEVDKLLYLKNSLKGDAVRIIDGLEMTNKNYDIAVSILKDKYGKENHVIDAHYAALYKIPKAPKGNITEVRNTFCQIERHLRILKSLSQNVDHDHLRFMILEKMPTDIVYELKLRSKTESIEEIRQHLEIIITAREDAQRITSQNLEEYTTQTLHTGLHNERENFTKPNRKHKSFPKHRSFQPRQEIQREEKFKDKSPFYRNTDYNRRPIRRKLQEQGNGSHIPSNKRTKFQCIFCRGSHYPDQCNIAKTVTERRKRLRGRCFNCLGHNHIMKDCKKTTPCVYCNKTKSHHRSLCPTKSANKTEETKTFHVNTTSSTVLQTAIVKALRKGDSSVGKTCRVLLDSGSQKTYITQEVASQLKLPIEEENTLSVFTFGSKTPQTIKSPLVRLQMKTRTNDLLQIEANVVPHISHGVSFPDINIGSHKRDLILADDGSLSSKIDILIGNDFYFSFILKDKIQLESNLFLIDSKFGYILTGRTNEKTTDTLSVITYFQGIETKLTPPDPPLYNGNIKCLWELESIGICDSPKATRDEEVVNQFNDTVEFVNDRYTVSWPWIDYPPELETNYGLAIGRLVNLLKRLDSESLTAYDNTMKEQLGKEIIEEVPSNERKCANVDHPIHYLPHHGVRQPGKPTRIVYDASAKTKHSKSLNECLHCGPLMLEDLTGMLLRFRSHQIGITADVEKAFLQIALHKKDKDVTRFLWLKDISKPATEDNILHLRFCRVPFGVISSPFLLNATLKHHLLRSNEENLKRIVNDIYVDNLVTGTESVREATGMYESCKIAFEEISMNLREWSSNSRQFLESIASEDVCEDIEVKVLGLSWNTEEDTIRLRSKKTTEANTKREILKNIASIYDPCGYAAPDLLPAKLLLQNLWMRKFKWDTPLPEEVTNEWQAIREQLDDTKDIVLPRKYLEQEDVDNIQLHAFTDASIKAYAAAVYISNGQEVSFVIGKSRLVPIKNQDNLKIPKLELLGVLIGSRLLKYVTKFLELKFTKNTIWTDSQIVIDWYYSNKLLPPFVARRIEEIKGNIPATIRHVPTELNPADVATRPTSSKEDRQKWLLGPEFLLKDPKTWPKGCRSLISLLTNTEISINTACSSAEHENFLSSGEVLTREERISKDQENRNQLGESSRKESTEDCENDMLSHTQKIRRIQKEYFPDEVEGKNTNLKRNLGIFTDIDGILRCKGRLQNADWSYDKRYPILIPKDCEFTNAIILETHKKNYHVGVNHTLSLIRSLYWIPQGRSQVKKILRKCTSCVKHGGGPFKLPTTPALPKERVNYSSPFTYTGIDYLGPLQVKSNHKPEKRWICLYTCLVVRAIHLEVVRDLTAEECLLALRRFISCRGVPTRIVSDNALQFKLTAEVLSSNYCITNKIEWKFIPQLAPWHGGFYERLVGLVKHCLKRTLTKILLLDNQLNTIIKEIEAVINTRPLTSVGSDLEDVLKPSDFLTLGKCIVITPSDAKFPQEGTITKQNLVEGWRRGQNMLKEFIRMFTDQYLPSLRERYQHSLKEPRVTKGEIPKLGDIVQIKGDTKNRESWKVGKITSLVKGTDGQCRVARVDVNGTEFTRSIAHLYPLEIEDNVPGKERMLFEFERENGTPTSGDLHLFEEIDSTTSTEDVTATPLTAVEPVDKPETEKKHINKDNLGEEITQRMLTAENDEPIALDEDHSNSSIPRSTDTNEIARTSEMREVRDASTKAREKIREWTRSLMENI